MIPETAHFFSAGVYAKQMILPKNHTAKSHKHNYDHLSILAQGEVDVVCNDVITRFKAPTCIEIKAGITHEIRAFEDSVFFCIHAIDETDKDNIDEVLIKKEVA
jgi:mannose-6-phosphate isomerase-like protein (cupin superfamily)